MLFFLTAENEYSKIYVKSVLLEILRQRKLYMYFTVANVVHNNNKTVA